MGMDFEMWKIKKKDIINNSFNIDDLIGNEPLIKLCMSFSHINRTYKDLKYIKCIDEPIVNYNTDIVFMLMDEIEEKTNNFYILEDIDVENLENDYDMTIEYDKETELILLEEISF